MNLNKRIRRILALSITSLVLILLMAVPIAASGIPESSGILESLGIVESSDIIDSSDILESSGNPESPAVQESSGESESPTIQESSEESESPTVQESLDYLETSTDPEISADPGVQDDPETSGKLEVHFIDVGQGDATLIRCDGHSMLIDGGAPGDTGLIANYLEIHRVTHLDYIVVSHGHSDHIGGLPDAVDRLEGNIDTVLAPYMTWNSKYFRKFTDSLSKYDIPISVPHVGDTYDLGSATFSILSVGSGTKNESIVLRLEHEETSVMFTGDATADQQDALARHGSAIQSDILKVPHHGSGSKDSICDDFVNAVHPRFAVFCSGSYNSFDHPSYEALSPLRDMGALFFRTDSGGDIIFTSDGKELSFTVEREVPPGNLLTPGRSGHYQYNDPTGESSGDSTDLTRGRDVTDKSDEKDEREPEGGIADESVSGSRHSDKSVSESGGESVSGSGGESRTSEEEFTYILNKSTMKFHYDYCSYIKNRPPENKETVTSTRKKVLADGYDPCGHCKP